MPRSWKNTSLPDLDGPTRLGRGDVKLLLLAALEGGPRHGYDLMKAVEALSGGRYIPSAGVVYPTLKHYAEKGLLKSEQVGEKRRYGLTAPGKKHLAQQREALAQAMERLRQGGAAQRPELRALALESQRLMREIFDRASALQPAQVQALRKLLSEATQKARRIVE